MKKRKILIIDDDEDFAFLMRANLERTQKYEVRSETKGTRAVVVAKQVKPDLILLDLLMPDRIGDKVAEQIKKDKEVRHIPIVFLTAVVTKQEIKAFRGMIGRYPFVPKDASVEELVRVIEQNLPKESQ